MQCQSRCDKAQAACIPSVDQQLRPESLRCCMANILSMLDEVRERPWMLGGRSLRSLEQICDGYNAAIHVHRIREDVPKICTFHFGEWLYRRFRWPHNRGW